MTAMQKLRILEDIDEKYIMEAKPRRLLKYGETKTQRFDPEDNSVLMVLETVLSVASIALIVGAVFIWTLVGKDLLWVGDNGDDMTDQHKDHSSMTASGESITSVPDTTTIYNGIVTSVQNEITTAPDTTTFSQDDTTDPDPLYTEGFYFKLNDENNGYVLYHYRHEDFVGVINIPSTYNGLPVTEIGEKVFYCLTMKEVNIPSSVKIIGDYAFYGCWGLEQVQLPSNLELIGDGAFYGCYLLKSVVIPEGVTKIGRGAFEGCRAVKEIIIPESVISIGGYAFQSCGNLEKLVLNEGLENIGEFAFSGCDDLTNFVIPDSVKKIGAEAFKGCRQLTDMTVPESVTILGNSIFSHCTNLKNVVINAKVKTINTLFQYCTNLEIIVFGEGVETFCDAIMSEFRNLKQIYLPSTVKSIHSYNFENWINVMHDDLEITYNGTVADWQAVTREYLEILDKPITVHCIDGDCIDGPVPISN